MVHFLLMPMMVVSFYLSVVGVFQIGPGVYIVDGRGSNGEDFGLLLTRIALTLAFIAHLLLNCVGIFAIVLRCFNLFFSPVKS